MMRRPPGLAASNGQRQRTKYLLAVAAFVLPWLQLADAQQQQQQQPQIVRSPAEDSNVSPSFATTVTEHEVVETPLIHERRKKTVTDVPAVYNNFFNSDDASALATSALEDSVRATSLKHISSQNARSLGDWEVEDFVLLATVDGDLYAADRVSGTVRWHLEVDQPMVESKHYRVNNSVLDEDYDPIDHTIWVVEPTVDGGLYIVTTSGLFKLPFTVKHMVEEQSPYHDKPRNLLYTGDKKTTIVTLNAANGQVQNWFSASGVQINEMESCLKPNSFVDLDPEECINSGSITIGRTEYTVGIHRTDGRQLATLKYTEWGTNTFDNDLIRQHQYAMDNRYITSKHDGQVFGFDFGGEQDLPSFSNKLSAPVARVFDVVRRWENQNNPDLVILPQPPPPDEGSLNGGRPYENVFINHTGPGNWYAMSGSHYPLVLQAPTAPIHKNNNPWNTVSWERLNAAEISEALVGIHPLYSAQSGGIGNTPPPLLSLPDHVKRQETENDSAPPSDVTAGPEPSPLLGQAKNLQREATYQIIALIRNPFFAVIAIMILLSYHQEFRRWYNGKIRGKRAPEPIEVKPTINTDDGAPEAKVEDEEPQEEPVKRIVARDEIVSTPEPESVSSTAPAPPTLSVESDKEVQRSVKFDDNVSTENGSPVEEGQTPLKKKKPAHRGRRGGQKHKKKDKRELSQSRDDDPTPDSIEEVIQKAKNLGPKPQLEPDIMTVTDNDVEDVSGPILRMGSLEVNEDQQLGTGSNGTVVYAGKWDGRDVAVKRMLIQFNEIATQETKLLRESDDHPNVIRYFAQQQRADFLYIALELCQASLADVVQKPQMFRELAQAGERNIPDVLYQITNGLSHLHSLRIVHRDLKPQNILITMKDGRPRLLVSDFGLCKKLEGGQSSFGATTAHAAGTSGWRAPELLLDDDAPSSGLDPGSSLHSGSGSGVLIGGGELLGPNHRRVTRAIDIFSLGLVFFYVLTKGNHPFDCGDRYMREVNIRKGKYNLQLLDALGDFAFDAHDLISSMLNAKPKERPTAKDVMAHPFFWDAKKRLAFLCDVSDHFEKEPREPPSEALQALEAWAPDVVRGDFLKHLPQAFVDSLGKQRKYTGTRMLDLLRALRNKRNHYEDMPEALRKTVGPLPDGYLAFWLRRFPNLLIACWNVVYFVQWDQEDRFREYYQPKMMQGW